MDNSTHSYMHTCIHPYIQDSILSRIYRVAEKLISPRREKEKIKKKLLRTMSGLLRE